MRKHEQTMNVSGASCAPVQPELSRLQELIDRSTRTAGASVADSVAFSDRQMSAAEFIEFWRGARLVAMATVGANGQPHIAPVHAQLGGAGFRFAAATLDMVGIEASDLTTLRMGVYDNAVRRADLARNSNIAFTTWREDGAAVILYGCAREIAGSLRPARPGRSGKPRQVVEVEVKLTRIYAMRAPERSAGSARSTSSG